MSLLIKGIDLPEAYTSAWLTVFECVGERTFIKTHKVSAEQMQAIPPHGRLIDGDGLQAFFNDAAMSTGLIGQVVLGDVCKTIAAVPTIIEAEEGEEDDEHTD